MDVPKRVWNREGTEAGKPTGRSYACQLEGCLGRRIVVRWPSGQITRPCSKGMHDRPDGDWQIG